MLGFSLSPEQLAEKERAHTFAEKMLSALRKQFGGHVEKR